MNTPTPAALSRPIPSALAQARVHADATADTAASIDLAVMWATLAQAEETHRLRREVRGLTDAVLRTLRALTEEVDG